MANQYVNLNYANPYAAQREELERQQKLAEILTQQSREPIATTEVGGFQGQISPLSGLAKMLDAYNANRREKDNKKAALKLNEDESAERSSDMAKIARALQGYGTPEMGQAAMGQVLSSPTGEQASPQALAGALGGQPRGSEFSRAPSVQGAYEAASGSRFPEIQQFGIEGRLSQVQDEAERRRQALIDADKQQVVAPGAVITGKGPYGKPVELYKNPTATPAAPRPIIAGGMIQDPVTGKFSPIPGYAEQQGQIARARDKAPDDVEPVAPTTTDPESGSILKQTGLTLPGFLAVTGQATKLPRDAASRNAAFKAAEKFANERGVDLSTFGSQYQAYNETLSNNIKRVNQTKIMEGELGGTIDNLAPIADKVSGNKVRLANVAKLLAGAEVNDPDVQNYRFQLQQLRSELAGYNGALQGRSGNNITEEDRHEADRVILNGLSSGGAKGLKAAVHSATEKMSGVLNNSVDVARKAVWDLFGVGDNYKPKFGGANDPSKLSNEDLLKALGGQ